MVQPTEDLDILLWADSICVDFPTDDIPVLLSPEEWGEWGNDLIQCTSFALNDAPSTVGYNNWREWAWNVYYTMANYA